jgi:protein-tyrosine phosphatase
MKILMVCLGNICRSPMAKGLLIKKLNEKNITNVEVDSAGTSEYHAGKKADERTLVSALKHGIDLTNHRARQFTRDDFDDFDRIYVMDTENLSDVLYLAGSDRNAKKVKLLLDEISPGAKLSVPDPWFGGEKEFEKVFLMLDDACDAIAQRFTL